ncbi:MAG: hypothetical protein M9904_10300 [Chitinophagaceae bacterium]|nr:hypothetical protein [Chitinophagaceae bacterium]
MKKAIIVGSTSGIGRQLVILLANKNYIVGITPNMKFADDFAKLQQEARENNRGFWAGTE